MKCNQPCPGFELASLCPLHHGHLLPEHRIIEFILSPTVLTLCEMKSTLSRTWNWVVDSIFYGYNHYIINISKIVSYTQATMNKTTAVVANKTFIKWTQGSCMVLRPKYSHLTQSTPAVSYNTTRLCWFSITLYKYYIKMHPISIILYYNLNFSVIQWCKI